MRGRRAAGETSILTIDRRVLDEGVLHFAGRVAHRGRGSRPSRLVVEPVRRRAPDTGVRLRGMIEKVLAFAQSQGHIEEDRVNPAIWSRLKDGLPDPDKLAKRLGHRRHHAAMP
jgi:hypothetical protein